MKTTIATSTALCLLSLTISACGASDSYAADQASAQADTVISTDQANAGISAAPSIAAAIDMGSAFSQILSCRAGVKPYFEPGTTDGWLVSFDGNRLDIAGHNQRFGGSLSHSGQPIERIEAGGTAKLQTQLGATGGKIWFERNALGQLISAGHTGRADANVVECGDVTTTTWLAAPTSTSFAKSADTLAWTDAGPIALNCAMQAGGQTSGSQAASLWLIADGELRVMANASAATLLQLPAAVTAQRSAGFVHESALAGGLRVWMSRAIATPDERFEARFRYDFKLLELRAVSAATITSCVPTPLQPELN